MLALMAREK